jgi:pentatricopeptide repeat protein
MISVSLLLFYISLLLVPFEATGTQIREICQLDSKSGAGTLRETAEEAAFTILLFLAAAAAVVTLKRRNYQNLSQQRALESRTKNKNAEEVIPSSPTKKISPSASTDSVAPYNPSASDGCSTVEEGDALAAAVRQGSACHLPSLLDAAEARARAAGADDATIRKLNAQHMLSSLRACASRHCFREALAVYGHMQGKIDEDCYCGKMWSLLLYSAVQQQEFDQCGKFVAKLMNNMQPSGNDFVNMVRFYASSNDIGGLTRVLGKLRTAGFPFETIVRNRAISVCLSCRALELAEVLADEIQCPVPMDTIGYNILMKAYANASQMSKCFDVYAQIQKMADQAGPSAVSFGILLDACIDAGDFDEAKRIFEDLRHSSIQLNVIHYTTLLKGLARAGHLGDATRVLEEMRQNAETQPDLITYSTLVKALADQGETSEAMRVIEMMFAQNVKPDGIILNHVLSSCTVYRTEQERITYVFHWLRRHGLQVTTATLSILLKAYAKAQSWQVALDLLEEAPSSLQCWPQPRLYAQLAQAYARSEEGSAPFVVRCYVAVVRSAVKQGSGIDDAMNSRFYRLCTSCGESAVAGAIYRAVMKADGLPELEVIADALQIE